MDRPSLSVHAARSGHFHPAARDGGVIPPEIVMDLTQLLALAQALGLDAYVSYLVAAIGIAAILAAVLPPATAASPAWWRLTREALDWCAANKGNARNAESVPPSGAPRV